MAILEVIDWDGGDARTEAGVNWKITSDRVVLFGSTFEASGTEFNYVMIDGKPYAWELTIAIKEFPNIKKIKNTLNEGVQDTIREFICETPAGEPINRGYNPRASKHWEQEMSEMEPIEIPNFGNDDRHTTDKLINELAENFGAEY